MKMKRCKYIIGTCWLLMGGGCLLYVALRSMNGFYDSLEIKIIWDWILPSILPTLSIVISVLSADAIIQRHEDNTINFSFFIITLLFSFVYLLMIFYIVINADNAEYLSDYLANTNFWISPFQGVVASLFGVFFVTGSSQSS